MDIFELLSFDFGEFITSPASICIIIGCLFLIVGIALYFKENKKLQNGSETEGPKEDKKEEVAEVAEAETAAPEVKTEEITPTVTEATPIIVPTEGDGVKEVEATPVVPETINFDSVTTVEKLDDTSAVTPVETLDAPSPAVTPVVAPVVESLDAPETPVVYGGANPEPATETLEEKPREIYGGANPLENTSPIPTETVREAYAGAQVNVAPATEPATPAVEPTPAPVVAPVVEAPATEPAAPAVEPVVAAAPEQPTEEVEKLEF